MLAIGRGKTKPAQEALFFLDGWGFARDLLKQSGVPFPAMDRDLDEAQTSALFGVTPLTTDETILGRIVALAQATRRLCLSDSWPEGRARFRRGVARQFQRRGLPPGSLTVSRVTA
jgi:hypothetical protein